MFENLRTEMTEVMGPLVDLPTPQDCADYAVIRAIIPAGVVVPLHSHPDRETFVVMAGRIRAYLNVDWQYYEVGDVIEIDSNVKHAIHNDGDTDAAVVLVTTARMTQFFNEVGARGKQARPTPERIDHFFERSAAYGYWNGTPEDQAAIGLSLAAMHA
ncbi:cupin domain-containing protein [Sphingomonas sp. PAMC 26605]|uniref:cupin domain-containing protein n=1 Tax=Sphingomonas sp. PAMC 26605 TaxID=1112214 RepID=UPI0012F489B3|nr:cupin domain-containing protein [Sphingomonas sp. PAMC 26605]